MVEGTAEYNAQLIQRLHKILRPFLLRRLKKEVELQLPSKTESVLMCGLSKRQRALYEEFLSRRETRDTLSSGQFISVIGVLMQLRKVRTTHTCKNLIVLVKAKIIIIINNSRIRVSF